MSVGNSSAATSANLNKDNVLTSSDRVDIDRRFQEEALVTGINSSPGDLTRGVKKNGTTGGSRVEIGRLVVSPPAPSAFTEFFRAIQKWEGKVIRLADDTFTATLSPIVGDPTELEAEMYVEDVTPDERHFIEPGAVFYWSIGYLERPSGRIRESVLRFRRLPVWTKDDISKNSGDLSALFEE
ncbi:MAG: hypothetical protein HY708_06960 [Ignavibacteriae bacterium]|nr:hypothetical protein [Ignavibacteriota bacterium]